MGGRRLGFAAALGLVALGWGAFTYEANWGTAADAEQLLGAAEKLADLPSLADSAAAASALGAALGPPRTYQRETRCEGHPARSGRLWRFADPKEAWFRAGFAFSRQPIFQIKVEDRPAACRSEGRSAFAQVDFLDARRWRCLTRATFGAGLADFATTYQGPNSARVLLRKSARPDGSEARIEMRFRGRLHECLDRLKIEIVDK